MQALQVAALYSPILTITNGEFIATFWSGSPYIMVEEVG